MISIYSLNRRCSSMKLFHEKGREPQFYMIYCWRKLNSFPVRFSWVVGARCARFTVWLRWLLWYNGCWARISTPLKNCLSSSSSFCLILIYTKIYPSIRGQIYYFRHGAWTTIYIYWTGHATGTTSFIKMFRNRFTSPTISLVFRRRTVIRPYCRTPVIYIN